MPPQKLERPQEDPAVGGDGRVKMKISTRGEKKQKAVFTSLPGTCFKYSKHVRRQLAQGIHNQGAVETETSVQNLPGSCFNIPNMRAGSSPKAFITKVRLKQRPEGDLHVERGDHRLTRRTWRP